jgi:hypothetical protein
MMTFLLFMTPDMETCNCPVEVSVGQNFGTDFFLFNSLFSALNFECSTHVFI